MYFMFNKYLHNYFTGCLFQTVVFSLCTNIEGSELAKKDYILKVFNKIPFKSNCNYSYTYITFSFKSICVTLNI